MKTRKKTVSGLGRAALAAALVWLAAGSVAPADAFEVRIYMHGLLVFHDGTYVDVLMPDATSAGHERWVFVYDHATTMWSAYAVGAERVEFRNRDRLDDIPTCRLGQDKRTCPEWIMGAREVDYNSDATLRPSGQVPIDQSTKVELPAGDFQTCSLVSKTSGFVCLVETGKGTGEGAFRPVADSVRVSLTASVADDVELWIGEVFKQDIEKQTSIVIVNSRPPGDPWHPITNHGQYLAPLFYDVASTDWDHFEAKSCVIPLIQASCYHEFLALLDTEGDGLPAAWRSLKTTVGSGAICPFVDYP